MNWMQKVIFVINRFKVNQYEILLRHVFEKGVSKSDRTGTGTKSVFGYQMRFDLSEGFPLITTKKIHIRSIIYELLWFLKGETNVRYLKDRNITIAERPEKHAGGRNGDKKN